jgi:hypothetical protein
MTPIDVSPISSHSSSRGGLPLVLRSAVSGNRSKASTSVVLEPRRKAAFCLGTLTVKVELAPAEPGVTVVGEYVKVAPGGRLVAVSVTTFVNGEFTEVMEML